ncbi:MAG: hypothetical protein LBF97_00945 [Elusimicrobiota bacterium]|jgi:hypothetical protein|nr:hypothetical protein [Elusimicrobiota bacterium]
MNEFFKYYNINDYHSTGKGWFKLVKPILEAVDRYNKEHYNIYTDEKIEIFDIKEKFGGLRISLSYYVPELEALVSEAEETSYKTCEECGAEENVSTEKITGWYKTLCDNCRKKFEEKRKEWLKS